MDGSKVKLTTKVGRPRRSEGRKLNAEVAEDAEVAGVFANCGAGSLIPPESAIRGAFVAGSDFAKASTDTSAIPPYKFYLRV